MAGTFHVLRSLVDQFLGSWPKSYWSGCLRLHFTSHFLPIFVWSCKKGMSPDSPPLKPGIGPSISQVSQRTGQAAHRELNYPGTLAPEQNAQTGKIWDNWIVGRWRKLLKGAAILGLTLPNREKLAETLEEEGNGLGRKQSSELIILRKGVGKKSNITGTMDIRKADLNIFRKVID